VNKDDRKKYLILKDKSVYKGLIFLAIPVMLNNFIKTIHDIVDMYFVSEIKGFGTSPIGSISVTFPVIFTFISLGMGLGIAGTALISQFVGANQLEDAKKYATNLVILSLIIGIALNIFAFFGSPAIMQMMGTKGYILEHSSKYLRIRSFELPALFLFFAYTSIRQASGDTVSPVVLGVITIVLNIILSPIFILDTIDLKIIEFAGLGLGVSGAAYATVISYLVLLPILFWKLLKSSDGITVGLEYVKMEYNVAKELIQTAIPASLGQSFTAIGFIVMTSFIISYGDDTVAAFNVSNRISSLILHPAMALGGILSAYVGQNIGNLNIERAKEAFKKAMILGVLLMSVGAALILNYREALASIFIKDSPFALELAVEYLFFLLIGLPLMAIFQTFIGVYNGTGNTKYTFYLGVTRLWLLRIPLILIFKEFTDLGSSGIWYAMILSNFVISIVGFVFYRFIDYKPKIRIG